MWLSEFFGRMEHCCYCFFYLSIASLSLGPPSCHYGKTEKWLSWKFNHVKICIEKYIYRSFFFFFFPLLSVSKHQQVHNLYNLVDQMKIKHACTYKTIIPQQKETYACVLTISLNRANRGSVFVELLSNQHFERLLSIIETLEK